MGMDGVGQAFGNALVTVFIIGLGFGALLVGIVALLWNYGPHISISW